MDPLSVAAIGWLMSALVSKAVTALLEAWAKRIGLGNEFETLQDQLLQLSALLTSARGLRTNNCFLEKLVQNLQQLAYQAENLLDELDYYRLEDEIKQRGTQENVNSNNKSSAASSSSVFHLTSHSILSTLEGMSHSARDALVSLPETFSSNNLSRRMNELAKQLQKSEEKVRKAVETGSLVITARNTEISQTKATNLPQTSSFLTVPGVVFGRDQERDQLVNLLTNEETAIVGKVPVLAIVGNGGVGKTTLAGLVFNDPKVKSYFKVRSWICVSTQFDIVRLTREMLEGACGTKCDLTNLNVLQTKLKDKLESKRFLLVLDDMWEYENKSQWDSLVALLNNCMVKRGIILVTTRNQSVVKMIDTRDNIYLKGLDENAFLSFFSICIFNDLNYGGNWRLRKIGQEIAIKLKGNPLAAKTVSALLREKLLDERYWMKIRDSEEWKSQSGPDDIMPALRLSYEHMPFHLQRCFSYCAMLPKDHPFTCEELVYLWMAQGFLDVKSEGKRMEDIGSAYFNDLFNHGFFQTIQSTYGDTMYYSFHDLIHDLAHMVASKECLTINGTESGQILPTIRHLSILNIPESGENATIRAFESLEAENLSTIINWDALPSGTFRNISDLLRKTKFLRTVKLILCFEVQQHNFTLQNFVSLRYLILSNFNSRMTLPRDICRLYHLEVFEIQGKNCLLNELPNNFSDLVSLRHFIVECKLHSKIRGVGKLTSLQELNYFDVQQKIGFEIEQLGSLKEIGGYLHIMNIENVKSKAEASTARLAEKEKLDALYLQWNYGEQENESVLEGLKPNTNLKLLEIRGYGGATSPTWLEPSLVFLESLTLKRCKAWEVLPPIGELEFLKHLKLSGLAVREIGPQCYGTQQSMKFPSLEELEIIDMPDLEIWVWSDHLCLKKLKKLTVENCTKLVDLPLSGCATSEVLERFPSVKSLIIEDCPLIFQLPPLPYSSVLSFISIARTGSIESMHYKKKGNISTLILDQSLSLKVVEVLAFHELSSLRSLEISNISSLESLDLHSFVALEKLVIEWCQSLTSLTFGELSSLCVLKISYFSSLESLDLHSFVALENLVIKWCQSLTSLTFGELSSLRSLEISNISSLESLDLHSFVALEKLVIEECQSLTSLTFGELSSLRYLEISHNSSLESLDLHSFVALEKLVIKECQSLPSLTFGELSSLCVLEISHISSLESLDLHYFLALEILVIKGCQSLTSLTFGEHLVCLRRLEIISCNTLSSMQGLKSWVNLKELQFRECPGFIAAWDSASKEIQRTEPDFSLSLSYLECDSLALLTLPICKQLTYLEILKLAFSAFTEEHEVSLQLLTSIDLVDIRGCKNLQSFPFDLFPSLRWLYIIFPRIQSLPTNSRTEITEECKKLRNIKGVHIWTHPARIDITVKPRGNDMPADGCS